MIATGYLLSHQIMIEISIAVGLFKAFFVLIMCTFMEEKVESYFFVIGGVYMKYCLCYVSIRKRRE